MKKLSIRFKITLWFTLMLTIVIFFTYFVIFFISYQILQKTIRDNLIETVENNVDEIEFYNKTTDIHSLDDVDYFIAYVDGYLEIDDDFLNHVNEVYTGLYNSNANLLYGENPILRQTNTLKFIDSQVQKITVNGTLYYIFDRKLTLNGLNELWLRGITLETQGFADMSSITYLSFILMPALILISTIGGYFIAGKMLMPIQKISDTALQIGKNSDLSKRIELGKGNDELHQLANVFNNMFQRLEDSFEMEHQFTSAVSHELRTPMSVIMAQCEFLLEQSRSVEEYEKALIVIKRQGEKMSRLIRTMLEFARLETQSEFYTKETINITQLVLSICSDMALIKENGISLDYEVQDDIKAKGNQELFSRLLINLISNAYRYGKENGHIKVSLKENKQEIQIYVQDDGIGIAKEEQQKIFRRFYQADNSRSGIGTGLGLAMAYEIAQFHGGNIHVESELEKGSTFIFTFPKNEYF